MKDNPKNVEKHGKKCETGGSLKRASLCKVDGKWQCYMDCGADSFTERRQLAKHLVQSHTDPHLNLFGLSKDLLAAATKPKNHGPRKSAPKKK